MPRRLRGIGGERRLLVVVVVPLVLIVLSRVPYSSAAAFDPLGDLVAKARGARSNASSSVSDPSMMPEPGPSSSDSSSPSDGGGDQEEEQQRQKKKKQAEAEAAERQAAADSKVYAKEKGLVSPTNGTGSYRGMAREFIDGHNAVRGRFGVPPLVWDKTVARQARRWSTAMRKDCQLLHSGTKHYGESVFRSHDDWNATAADAVHWWGTEEPLYDRSTGKCNGGRHFKECGHFALMVSKKYQRLGCGRAECYKGGVFITCNYYKNQTQTDAAAAAAPSPSPASAAAQVNN